MANLTAITSWAQSDVQHFARRAGFGLRPADAALLAGQAPGTVVDAWVDGTGLDTTLYDAVLATRADPVTVPAVSAGTGGADVPAVPGPHAYLVGGADAWRNDLSRAQASLAFRMQYDPYAFRERMTLFWHNLFATGWTKVNNVALMLKQQGTFRGSGLGNFGDLLVLVSQDPAMCIWLDSVLNNAAGSNIPNENYAREVMELYSLGADNGYSQTDITQLARALSGWSFTVTNQNLVPNPANPGDITVADGVFHVYDGSANPEGNLWDGTARATLPNMHATGTITYLGATFNVATPPTGMAKGEDALRSILTSRGPNCAQFLAKRFLTHFVTARYTSQDLADVQALVQSSNFDVRTVLKALLKSQYFYDPTNRFALVEGPVSWTVRAARMLGMDLATADAQSTKGFPAWALVAPSFEQAGMKLLDPAGPNGWAEDTRWMNSNTIRYRTRLAAAVALGETTSSGGVTYTVFPSDPNAWFSPQPASALDLFNQLVALLQPAPIPTSLRDGWLSALWPTAYTFDVNKARELAFLILCSPAGQLY